MNASSSRFSIVRRRPVLSGAIAVLMLGVAAAAGQRIYQEWIVVEGFPLEIDDGAPGAPAGGGGEVTVEGVPLDAAGQNR